MTLDMLIEKTRDSIDDLDTALATMLARLDEISRMSAVAECELVEIGAIVNNLSYMLLYLESNSAHVTVDYIERYRSALTNAPDRNKRLRRLLETLSCDDNECEASRRAFVTHLSLAGNASEDKTGQALTVLQEDAKAILDRLRHDKASFLASLGAHVGEHRPDVVFYRLLSDVSSEKTRRKLTLAWERLGKRQADSLKVAIDGMVGLRRSRIARHGGESVLNETLSRCGVSEKESREYWEEVLLLSINEHERLEVEINGALSSTGDVKSHFGRYLKAIRGDRSIPPIPLMPCIDYMLAVTKTMFGVSAKRIEDVPDHMMTFDMFSDGCMMGRINFDLWDAGSNRRTANTTTGVRNRTDWRGIVQNPVAHVSCRFRKFDDANRFITFQNAHSLFHEFGHAMNHLLIKCRLPNLSGLEFLPLERLEILSMWFERWTYHSEFERFLSFSDDDLAGLELSRKIKMLEYRRTHLERAVICALDFEVHGAGSETIENSYKRIDSRFGVSRYCELPDVLEYFTWPMLLANPGAYFAYLWGAGVSASRFAPLMHKSLAEMPGPSETLQLFHDCFSFDAKSARPNPRDVFGFYNNPGRPIDRPGLN